MGIHLPLERIEFLTHGLHLVPGVGLVGLELPQLGVMLLHPLLQILAARRGAAAEQERPQAQGKKTEGGLHRCLACVKFCQEPSCGP